MHFSSTTRNGSATWGQKAFAQIDQPAICYASLEWTCFSRSAGGLGRAFLTQTAAMIRGGEFPIRALFLHYQEGQLEPEILCPDDEDAMAVAPFLAAPEVAMQWFKGMQVTYPPTLLLEWLRVHPKACKILHVADWNGLGALVTLAVRSTTIPTSPHQRASPWTRFSDLIGGTRGGSLDKRWIPTCSGTPSSTRKAKRISRFPNTFIIPNIVHPLPQSMITRLPNGDRLVIFYGKINSRKGFNLFIKSILLVPKQLLSGLQIAIVGPMLMSNETVTCALAITP